MSAERAFEHLMLEILRQARESSIELEDLDVLFSCLSMLEIGLVEAQASGIVFKSTELRELDPYGLLDQFRPPNGSPEGSSSTVIADRAFECLMLEIEQRAREASEEDDYDILFVCIDMLEKGLIKAKERRIVFRSAKLRELDPYKFLDQFRPYSMRHRSSATGLESLAPPPVDSPPSAVASPAPGQVSFTVNLTVDDGEEPSPPPPASLARMPVSQIIRELPSLFPYAFPAGVLMLVLVIVGSIHMGHLAPGAFIVWAIGTPLLAGVFRVLSWFIPPMPKR